MLILTRKVNESLTIGDSVVFVLGIERNRIKIGVAGSDKVVRTELLKKTPRNA